MNKPQTNFGNVCAQLISVGKRHPLGDAGGVLCFHMYKLQTCFETTCMLRILLETAMPWPALRFVAFSYVQTTSIFWNHIYAADSIGESHAMTTPSICCVFICTNPNQTPILCSGGNLQLPRTKKKFICISFKIVLHLMAWPGPIDFRFEQGLIEVCTYEKPACQSFGTSRVPATVNSLIGRVFRVCSGFVHMKTQHARDLAANELFSSFFAVDWCLLMLLAVSHRLFASTWEWQVHVFHRKFGTSNYCVCSLALDFIVTRCVSPCPWNFNVGPCINARSFGLSAGRRVWFFTFVSSTLAWGGRG